MVVQVGDIDEALHAHREWTSRLNQGIASGAAGVSVEVAAADDRCALGQWLQHLDEPSEHAKTVKRLHTQFHHAVGVVLHFASTGKRNEAEALIAHSGGFSTVSRKLEAALEAWKAELLRRTSSPPSPF